MKREIVTTLKSKISIRYKQIFYQEGKQMANKHMKKMLNTMNPWGDVTKTTASLLKV